MSQAGVAHMVHVHPRVTRISCQLRCREHPHCIQCGTNSIAACWKNQVICGTRLLKDYLSHNRNGR